MLKKMLQSDSDVVNYKLEKLAGSEGLGKEVLFGRGADVDFALDSQRCPLLISRKHARIKRVANSLILSDTKSTNGTFVNDVKLGPNESRVLKDNDVISFGGASKVKQMNSLEEEFNPFLYKLKHSRRLYEPPNHNATQLASVDHTGALPSESIPSFSFPRPNEVQRINVPQRPNPQQRPANEAIIDLTDEPVPARQNRLQTVDVSGSKKSQQARGGKPRGGSLKRSNVVNLDSDTEGGLVVPPLRKTPNRAPQIGPSPIQTAAKGENPTLKALEAQFECQICREFLIGAHSLVPCGHLFCGDCACEWLDKKKTCPACREATTSAPVPLVKIDNIIEEIVVPHMTKETKAERDRRKIAWARNKAEQTKKMDKIHKKVQPDALLHHGFPGEAIFSPLNQFSQGSIPPMFSLPFPVGQMDFGPGSGRNQAENSAPRAFRDRRQNQQPNLGARHNLRNLPSGQHNFSVAQLSGRTRTCGACPGMIQANMPMILRDNGPNDIAYYHVGCEARIPGFLGTWRAMSGNIPGAGFLGRQNQTRINALAANNGRR